MSRKSTRAGVHISTLNPAALLTVYCRTNTPDVLVEHFCRTLVSRRDHIPWDIGPVHQPPLPLQRMVHESPATSQDVPMHPQAAAVRREHGYLP